MRNAPDAAIPIQVAVGFVLGQCPLNRRCTCGYSRAVDLADIVIVLMITLHSVLVAWRGICYSPTNRLI